MIKLSNVCIDGFRLLEAVSIAVEPGTTVIVGRNNSGKTSLMEVFDKFLGERAGQFRLEDFSASFRAKFLSAKALREAADATADDVLAALPVISLDLTFSYDAQAGELGPLSPFIIDLDPDCTTAIARLEYSPTPATLALLLDVPAAHIDENPNAALFGHLRDTIPKSYSIKTFAIDPTDPSNRRAFDNSAAISTLLQVGFVKAQRTLDTGKRGDPDVIGKLLNKLFKAASSQGAARGDQMIVADLMTSVGQIEASMQGDFDSKLKELLPALNLFGFPSLNDTELVPQTSIDVESLLTDNTRILYNGADGVHLPATVFRLAEPPGSRCRPRPCC